MRTYKYTCACAPTPQDFFLHQIFKTRNSNESATNSFYLKHLKYKTKDQWATKLELRKLSVNDDFYRSAQTF